MAARLTACYAPGMAGGQIKPEIEAAVRDIVERDMGPFGLRSVSVSEVLDREGDAILLIDANYDPVDTPTDPKIVAGLITKLRDRLWGLGEARFPKIRHHFIDGHKFGGLSAG